jgi:nicotinamide phosphoribosyltransferase
MDFNIILASDSYKCAHHLQYPPKTEVVYSYFESRGGRFKDITFFGLQYFLKEYLEDVVVTEDKINEAAEYFKAHFGDETLFNEKGWRLILEKHGGKLPARIKAVPEGSVIPYSNVMMTIENTDPECYWLTNYLETLLVQVWYPCTVATQSREIRKLILSYLEKTGTPELVDFKLHDFGFRGVSSLESAGLGGLAHLVNFKGTDTLAALVFAKNYYKELMAGFSIPASEHSTMTAWGKENEAQAFKNMLEQYANSPFVACVSDSYNIRKACEDIWGKELKEDVENFKGTLVVRPDSGDPEATVFLVMSTLDKAFGHTINSKGFKVLNNVAVIQGDGVDMETIEIILGTLKLNGYSADNIAFGMGGALLQKLDRDTQKFAFKCSSVTVDGEERDVWKEPVGAEFKKSKRGRMRLIEVPTPDGIYYDTVSHNNLCDGVKLISGEMVPDDCETCYGCARDDLLQTVFENGEITKEYTLAEVRENSLKGV